MKKIFTLIMFTLFAFVLMTNNVIAGEEGNQNLIWNEENSEKWFKRFEVMRERGFKGKSMEQMRRAKPTITCPIAKDLSAALNGVADFSHGRREYTEASYIVTNRVLRAVYKEALKHLCMHETTIGRYGLLGAANKTIKIDALKKK